MTRVRITEYLDVDLDDLNWCCNRCGRQLGPADRNYKEGCLAAARDPGEVLPRLTPDAPYDFAADPDWCQLVEFYCPGCATLIEVEVLPPGHPVTWDIKPDLAQLKARFGGGAGA